MRGAWSDEGKESRELSAKSWQETVKSPPFFGKSPLVFLSPNRVAGSSRRPQRKTRVQECKKTGRRPAFTALNAKGNHASQQTRNKNTSLFRILVLFLSNTASKNTLFRAPSSYRRTPTVLSTDALITAFFLFPLFHHENPFVLPFECRMPYGLPPIAWPNTAKCMTRSTAPSPTR